MNIEEAMQKNLERVGICLDERRLDVMNVILFGQLAARRWSPPAPAGREASADRLLIWGLVAVPIQLHKSGA